MRVSAVVPVVDGDSVSPEILGEFDECVIADGGGGAACEGALVVRSARGRAVQMNAGAAAATGDVLLFLHADTRLPAGAAGRIREAMGSGAAGGCFKTVFDHPHPLLRMGDVWRNLRARAFGRFYGDQSIFIRRNLFVELGGFRPLPFMEDYDLCRRMARRGRPVYIPCRAVTSARRFLSGGIVRTWLRHQRLKARYFLARPE